MKHIKIINTDGIGMNTRVVDADTDEQIPGVYRVELIIDVNKPIVCKLFCRQVAVDVTVDEYVRSVEIVRTGYDGGAHAACDE